MTMYCNRKKKKIYTIFLLNSFYYSFFSIHYTYICKFIIFKLYNKCKYNIYNIYIYNNIYNNIYNIYIILIDKTIIIVY